jgi:HAD superfamily hydrolase (TIGR01509 family)
VISALIFDFDGLILDTESPIYQSWLELFASQGQALPWDLWVSQIGITEDSIDLFAELETMVGHPLNRAALMDNRRRRETTLVNQKAVQPGVRETLDAAHSLGLKTAVASSASREWVAGHLTRLALIDYFTCLKTSDDVQRGKPAPDLFLAVLEELGLSPAKVVAFEDSPHGIHAAKSAGIYTVAVPNPVTRTLDLSEADLRLDSLLDIPLNDLLRIAQGV